MIRRMIVPATWMLLFCVSASGDEDTGKLVVDGHRAKQYVVTLSADDMQGRMTCTEGYRKAADWVAGRFKAWGLQPAGEDGTYFQWVTIRGFDWNTGIPALKIRSRDFLFDDGDYSVDELSTADTTQQGEIVFVGYGISAPDRGLDEYEDVDVEGKIVLAMKGSPKDAPPLRRRFQPNEEAAGNAKNDVHEEEWKDEATDIHKARTAYEHGAAAIMLYDPAETPQDTRRRSPASRRPSPRSFTPERSFLCFTIRERVFRAIMRENPQESPSGLRRRTDGIRRAIKQKRSQSRAMGVRATLKGYDVSVRYDAEHGNDRARNVLARIEGTDPNLKKEYVLVGAHLDHIGVRNGYVYNGADDNASGSAVVLEVARVLSQTKFKPRRTLVFCCWTGEERGLLGSLHYTNQPCGGVTMDQVVAYFNIDMVGMGEDLGASGALNFPTIWDVIQRDQDSKILEHVKASVGGPGGSDHTGFIKRGIEAIMLMSRGGTGHQDYHQPEDDSKNIEPEMLRLTGQFVLQGMVNLANETKANLLIPRRQQLYRAMRMSVANFNPQLPGSKWSVVTIPKSSKQALYDEIYDQTRKLLAKTSTSGAPSDEEKDAREKKSLSRGLEDLRPLADDMRLLQLAVDFYGIGRVDIRGDEGAWVANGRLTDVGREALRTLEENGVVIRLISPGHELINDILSAASKPFIITGDYTVTDAMVDRLNARGVRLGIDLDPNSVGEFIARVEKTKNQLGERANLFAFLTTTEGLEKAKRGLYLGLIDRGWTHNEICGSRNDGGLVGGENLLRMMD